MQSEYENRERDTESFGRIPSAEIRQLDYAAWWAVFMNLVGGIPERPEDLRLSDDAVHMVHGQLFSIRDCAARAVDAAYADGLQDTALDFTEQARKLVRSYDRLVFTRVSRYYDEKRSRYLVTFGSSMILTALFSYLYGNSENGSTGFLILTILAAGFAVASGGLALWTVARKNRILRRERPRGVKENRDLSHPRGTASGRSHPPDTTPGDIANGKGESDTITEDKE